MIQRSTAASDHGEVACQEMSRLSKIGGDDDQQPNCEPILLIRHFPAVPLQRACGARQAGTSAAVAACASHRAPRPVAVEASHRRAIPCPLVAARAWLSCSLLCVSTKTDFFKTYCLSIN